MKEFKVCVASRYMHNDYRYYDIYAVSAKNLENARMYAKRVISYWNNKDTNTMYEVYDIWEEK